MANEHGGARKGAGRPAKKVVHAGAIKRAEKKIADHLAEYVDDIHYLAKGGFEEVSETVVEELAATIMVDATEVIEGPHGPRSVKVKQHAFPDADGDTMVVTKRTTTTTISAPNLAALMYLINRIMGTPTNKHEFANMSDQELLREAARLFGGEADADE